MAYPVDMLTRLVQLPQVILPSGQVAEGELIVSIQTPMRWQTTQQLILQAPVSVDLVNGAASIELPVVQEGFESLEGYEVVTFPYTFTLATTPDAAAVPLVVKTLNVSPSSSPYILEFADTETTTAVVVKVPVPGAPGAPGHDGVDGAPGDTGPAPTLTIGTVTTTTSDASAEIVPDGPGAYKLNLVLPRGEAGSPGSAAGVPSGGAVGTFLRKNGVDNFDTNWATILQLPDPTSLADGTRLVVVGGAWTTADALVVRELPDPSSLDDDQILATDGGEWVTIALPVGGGSATYPDGRQAGYVLTAEDSDDVNGVLSWQPPLVAPGAGFSVWAVYAIDGVIPAQPASPPAGVKVRIFFSPTQYSGAKWPGVLDVNIIHPGVTT